MVCPSPVNISGCETSVLPVFKPVSCSIMYRNHSTPEPGGPRISKNTCKSMIKKYCITSNRNTHNVNLMNYKYYSNNWMCSAYMSGTQCAILLKSPNLNCIPNPNTKTIHIYGTSTKQTSVQHIHNYAFTDMHIQGQRTWANKHLCM